MYGENGYGGIPDELPTGYGYADAQPATVHTNAPTAKTLFEPEAQYQAPPPPVQKVVMPPNSGHRPSVSPSSVRQAAPQGARAQAQAQAAGYGAPPRSAAATARPVGPRPFQSSGLHTSPSNVTNMRARQTEAKVVPGVPEGLGFGAPMDSFAGGLGADYGLTSEERETKRQKEREARGEKRTAHKELKAADKAKLRAWQQAAQLGLRYDPTRGKWYRDVKISGPIPQASAPSTDHPLLGLGAKGRAVQRAQTLLAENGFECGKDGVFSATVQTQVRAFQKSEGLKADGKIGPETWDALDSEVRPAAKTSTGQTVRQYQDGAITILKGALPPGASHGAVLSPSKYGPTIAAIKSDLDENYDVFPVPDLTPPPANWDTRLGKMKPGFALDVDKLSSTLKTVAGRFRPSGKAAPATESFDLEPEAAPVSSSRPWLIAGGITTVILLAGGLYYAFRSEPPAPKAMAKKEDAE